MNESRFISAVARFFNRRNEARAACMVALEPWQDARGYWHMEPFPWREWLVWGRCQLVLLAVACGAIGLLWLVYVLIVLAWGLL